MNPGGLLRRALCAAALGSLALAAPAGATLTGPGVRAGHNISVFANIDFVGVFGYSVGSPMTVELVRNGHVINRVSAETVATPEGGGLEINHGPAGAPQPGDCWTNFTPDVRAGDIVRVTADGGTDEVTVDRVVIDTPPTEQASGEIWMTGIAERGDGTPVDIAALDSGEVRNGPKFRANPDEIVRTAGTANGWTAIWRAPFEDTVFRNDTAADPRQAILGADILGMGFGHIVPLPLESMLADGVGDTPGPALGCEGSPAAASAIGATSLDTVNIAALGAIAAPGDVALTLSGPAAADATAGTVILSDGGSSVFALAQGVADGGWTATFTKAQLEGLADGTLTATPSFETPTGAVNGSPLKIVKDTAAPTLDPTLPPGTYSGVQQVGIAVGGADKVTYSLDGAAPQTYAGIPVELKAGTHTLTGTATDAAGNVTTASWTYAIDAPASAPPVAGPTARPTPTVTTTTVPSSRSLVVRDLHMRRSLRRSEIRRRGITASMRLAAGTRTVRIAVYRRVGPGELELVTRTVRTPGKGGAYRVRLAGNLRKALTPGRYVLVVTPGRSESRFVSADERQRSFRVTQR